jgi:phosphoglycerate dehydrogenase-like enzyme
MLGAAELAAMRPAAWLLNVGRGALIDEKALVQALERRTIGGAVLDVFTTEPLPADHPLWGLDNAVITPHISGPNMPEEIAPVFNDNLARYRAGRPLRHVVDRRRGY